MTTVRPQFVRLLVSAKNWLRHRTLVVLSPLAVLAVILPNAWITEDAFISLRVAKNMLLGYGPNWNVDERVQVFTHPLWMGFLTITQAIFPDNVSPAVIWMGIIFTLAAVILFLKDIKSPWLIALVTVALVSSKAFIDYSTSGLENPLVYVLVILFAGEYLGRQRVFWLTLFASLAVITRADTAALIAPAFIPLIWKHWRERAFWFSVIKGAIPLIAWEAFSFLYYGYLLPNTVYAKVHTYIPRAIMDSHAYNYFANSLDWDKLTLPIIALGLLLTDITRDRRRLFLAAGILLYLLAIVRAGGDYMSGRFFAVPFFLSLYLVARWLQDTPNFHRLIKPALASVILLLAVITPQSPVRQPLTRQTDHRLAIDIYRGDVADEAEVYCRTMCLYNLGHLSENEYVKTAESINGQTLMVLKSIGLTGYLAEPGTHIVDELALADPLLSHLPAYPKSRAGHYVRELPEGYLEGLKQGHANLITEPCARRLYDDIRPVVTGPILSFDRFKRIIKLNTGYSDKKYERCIQRGGI